MPLECPSMSFERPRPYASAAGRCKGYIGFDRAAPYGCPPTSLSGQDRQAESLVRVRYLAASACISAGRGLGVVLDQRRQRGDRLGSNAAPDSWPSQNVCAGSIRLRSWSMGSVTRASSSALGPVVARSRGDLVGRVEERRARRAGAAAPRRRACRRWSRRAARPSSPTANSSRPNARAAHRADGCEQLRQQLELAASGRSAEPPAGRPRDHGGRLVGIPGVVDHHAAAGVAPETGYRGPALPAGSAGAAATHQMSC